MKSSILIAAGLLLPASLFAGDVRVSVSINSPVPACPAVILDNDYYNEADYDYVSDGDPWFEECGDQGPSRASIEYQWVVIGFDHVLRFRQVTFHTINSAWWFGPWSIQPGFCHPTCGLHHHHVFYHCPAPSPYWVRSWNHHGPRDQYGHPGSYFYEYRQPVVHHQGQPRVYRYEYKPRHHVNNDRGHHNSYGNRGNEQHVRPEVGRQYNHDQQGPRQDNNFGQGNRGQRRNPRDFTPPNNNNHQGSRQDNNYQPDNSGQGNNPGNFTQRNNGNNRNMPQRSNDNNQKPQYRNNGRDNATHSIDRRNTDSGKSNANNRNLVRVSGRERVR